ncbi:MAG: hypothetical protein JSR82_04120 [Verrucomicrobia bacterium]|nr:hypothetical protein [Verrucomicrobiota bacterium]
MNPTLRAAFNASFRPERYDALVEEANTHYCWPTDFRISETPLFLTPEFTAEIAGAARELVRQLQTPAFAQHAADSIPPGLRVPNETAHPIFIQVDFAICTTPDGRLTPRLIELQGFPSLYGFQVFLGGLYRRHFGLDAGLRSYFGGLDDDSYVAALREAIVGSCAAENVVLLEIKPEEQKTRIDFAVTEALLGVRPVCLTQVRKRGRQLFYERDGREVRIERIYNRVIFDELQRKPLDFGFSFLDELDVTWIGHPNWYFRISKHSLPFLKSAHTSPAYFADQFPAGEDLGNYVLKPLYSFAGLGVDMEPTAEKLAALDDPHGYILQQKVAYDPFLPTVEGHLSKAEMRMMFLWPEGGQPQLVNNLVRMSQGKMMGVDFNKNKTWVGASVGLHHGEPG